MKSVVCGAVVLALLLGVQCAPAGGPGGGLIVHWTALGVLWFCLVAPAAAGILVSWLAGWALETVSAAPVGLHAATLPLAGFLAARMRGWVRRDTVVSPVVFVNVLFALLVGLEGAWAVLVGGVPVSVVARRAAAVAAGSFLASIPLVALLQKGVAGWLPAEEGPL